MYNVMLLLSLFSFKIPAYQTHKLDLSSVIFSNLTNVNNRQSKKLNLMWIEILIINQYRYLEVGKDKNSGVGNSLVNWRKLFPTQNKLFLQITGLFAGIWKLHYWRWGILVSLTLNITNLNSLPYSLFDSMLIGSSRREMELLQMYWLNSFNWAVHVAALFRRLVSSRLS